MIILLVMPVVASNYKNSCLILHTVCRSHAQHNAYSYLYTKMSCFQHMSRWSRLYSLKWLHTVFGYNCLWYFGHITLFSSYDHYHMRWNTIIVFSGKLQSCWVSDGGCIVLSHYSNFSSRKYRVVQEVCKMQLKQRGNKKKRKEKKGIVQTCWRLPHTFHCLVFQWLILCKPVYYPYSHKAGWTVLFTWK